MQVTLYRIFVQAVCVDVYIAFIELKMYWFYNIGAIN